MAVIKFKKETEGFSIQKDSQPKESFVGCAVQISCDSDSFVVMINNVPYYYGLSAHTFFINDVDVTGNTSVQISDSIRDDVTSGGNSGGSGGGVVSKTYAEMQSLQGSFVVGQVYAITDADSDLYGGTKVIVKSVDADNLERQGTGFFYNPKYNQAVAGFGVWTNKNKLVISNIVGTFTANENITANNGATGTMFCLPDKYSNILLFVRLTGNWAAATSITGAASGATADIDTVTLISYAVDDTVIWGGKHWTNVNGNVGASTDMFTLNGEWEEVAFNATDYNYVSDKIEYDFENNKIVRREDNSGNIIIHDAISAAYWAIDHNFIKAFQWGNGFDADAYKGVGGCKAIEGYINNLNFRGTYMITISVYGSSKVENNDCEEGAYFDSIKLEDYSIVGDNHLISSSIASCYLADSDWQHNEMSGFSGIFRTQSHLSNIQSNKMNGDGIIEHTILSQNSAITDNNLLSGQIQRCNLTQNSNISLNTIKNTGKIRYVTLWGNYTLTGQTIDNTITELLYYPDLP